MDRARELVMAWQRYPGRNTKGVATFRSKGKEVSVVDIRFDPADVTKKTVLIWLEGKDPDRHRPDYRIVNPPLLRASPLGGRTVRGVPHIMEPLSVLAEVIGR